MKSKRRKSLLAVLVCVFALVLSLGLMSACGDDSASKETEPAANAQWYYGSESPAENLGTAGDHYLDTKSLTAYVRSDSGEWLPTNLFSGSGAPENVTAESGDLYLDTEGGVLYQMGETRWEFVLKVMGKDGRDGVLWLSGAEDPDTYPKDNVLVKDALAGDFYLNTTKFTVWQLGADGETWNELGSIASRGVQDIVTSGNKLTITFTDGTSREFEVASCFGKHDFGASAPTTIIEATCTERGLILKTCTVCGTSVVESVEPLGHQFVDGVCSVCGKNQLEGHYEVTEDGNCEVTISPDLVEEGGNLTIASTVDDAAVKVKGAVTDEAAEKQDYPFRTWLRGVSSAKTNPNVNLHINTLVIEEGVDVGAGAFAGATIEHLVLEGNASYSAYAFESVKGLQDVKIKGEVTLGVAIFDADATLQSVDMSEATFTELPTNAFSDCKNLSDVKLPTAGLETIEVNAFVNCSSLQHIILPEGLKTIKECAFSEADIREIVFPTTLTEIQIYVFQDNKNMQTAVFQSKIDASLFGTDKSHKQIHANTIFSRCGSRDVPLQICFTGSKEAWAEEEFGLVINSSASQQVVYDYKLPEG